MSDNIWLSYTSLCVNTSRIVSGNDDWSSVNLQNERSTALLERTLRRLHVQPRDSLRMRIDWSPGWPGFAIFYTISKVTSFTSLVFFYIGYNDRWVINKLH